MTDVATIDAGPETDRLVADAVGFIPAADGWWRDDGHRMWHEREFCPSTDWTAAMLAAERFGLFDYGHHGRILGRDFDGIQHLWCVCRRDGVRIVTEHYDPSGPLAIARAILALSAVSRTQVSK